MKKCETSDEKQEYMAQMKANGCLPNVIHFNVLINQLLREGQKEEAQRQKEEAQRVRRSRQLLKKSREKDIRK